MSTRRRTFLQALPFAALSSLTAARPVIAADDPPWIRPRAVRPGDSIRFVAPAGPPEADRVETCRRLLEAKGFRVVIPKDLFRADRYLAGSDEQRADELNAAIHDPDARAIFPCRGGYGLMRILDRIDYAAIRKDPKVITGYSDLTALHLAIARKSRVVTFHSPMPESALYSEEGDRAYAASAFWKMVRGEGRPEIDPPQGQPAPTRLVGGRATGRLTGGNLTLLCAMLGTPYAVEPAGKILFIEDTGEAPYRIDRYFAQLRLAGVLDAIAGLIVGSFDKTDVKEVDAVVREYASRLKIPVIQGFPVGHTTFNTTLPHGGLAELDADAVRVRLLEDPVVAR